MKNTKDLIKSVLGRNIFYAQVLITMSFLVPIYSLYIGNSSISLLKYFSAIGNFLYFGGTCILASFCTAVVFELIDNKVKNIGENIVLKAIFSLLLIAVAFYYALISVWYFRHLCRKYKTRMKFLTMSLKKFS